MSDPDVEGELQRGEAALIGGEPRAAAEIFAELGRQLPADPTFAIMEGNAWRLAGDTVAARQALQRASRIAGAMDIPSLFDLGGALLDTGAPTEALACFARVAKDRPKDPSALNALAGAMRANGDPKGAWPVAQRALGLAPTLPALLLTAAHIRHALGDLDGAKALLDRAEALRPDHALTKLQRGLTTLIGGACQQGWEGFEYRGLPVSQTGATPWHGEPLDGSSIAVLAEQGIGDQFHFARYIPRLRELGASRVVVECHPGAVSLFLQNGFEAVPKGAAPPSDWYVPMLSLPHRLQADRDTAGLSVPYLRVGDTSVAPHVRSQSDEGKDKPGRSARPITRLGLVLAGNPAFLATQLRDFDQALLPDLLAFEDVEWVWLQYPEPAPFSHDRLITPQLSPDWLDTAILLSSLDGVVSVDTSMAHLAGAMGIPVYVLLPYSPDWRWGLKTKTTPWYPSARLMRQERPHDWKSAIRALRAELSG